MSRGRLWFGVAGPPLAWIADEVASLYVHESACLVFGNPRLFGLPLAAAALFAIGVVMLAVAAAAALTALRASRGLGTDTGGGALAVDQDRFMARAGMLSGAVFGFGIVLRLTTEIVVPVCRS